MRFGALVNNPLKGHAYLRRGSVHLLFCLSSSATRTISKVKLPNLLPWRSSLKGDAPICHPL
uniref:Uncharacterized protein n=1 Tax=Rhizophora mucronata TaxID=61149 RepID=A0A2P2PTI9_RHIMU